MPTQKAFIRPMVAVSTVLLLTLAAGCSKPAVQGGTSATPTALANATPILHGKAASKLGDLTAFQSIATDVAAIVEKGDLPAAKARIKDLEIAWDSAEAGLKPRAADDWHVLDKAIDKALTVLRADGASQADCRAAMAVLLKTFDALQGAA
jgi:hypothetical protein